MRAASGGRDDDDDDAEGPPVEIAPARGAGPTLLKSVCCTAAVSDVVSGVAPAPTQFSLSAPARPRHAMPMGARAAAGRTRDAEAARGDVRLGAKTPAGGVGRSGVPGVEAGPGEGPGAGPGEGEDDLPACGDGVRAGRPVTRLRRPVGTKEPRGDPPGPPRTSSSLVVVQHPPTAPRQSSTGGVSVPTPLDNARPLNASGAAAAGALATLGPSLPR